MSIKVWDFDDYHRKHLKYLILEAAADKLDSKNQLYHSLLSTGILSEVTYFFIF